MSLEVILTVFLFIWICEEITKYFHVLDDMQLRCSNPHAVTSDLCWNTVSVFPFNLQIIWDYVISMLWYRISCFYNCTDYIRTELRNQTKTTNTLFETSFMLVGQSIHEGCLLSEFIFKLGLHYPYWGAVCQFVRRIVSCP